MSYSVVNAKVQIILSSNYFSRKAYDESHTHSVRMCLEMCYSEWSGSKSFISSVERFVLIWMMWLYRYVSNGYVNKWVSVCLFFLRAVASMCGINQTVCMLILNILKHMFARSYMCNSDPIFRYYNRKFLLIIRYSFELLRCVFIQFLCLKSSLCVCVCLYH